MRGVTFAAIVAMLLTGTAGAAGAAQAQRCALRHHAHCARADLHGRDLHGAILHHADLRGAILHHADLHGAVLHHADLRGTIMHHVNLRGADLEFADLRGVDLRHADLRGAHLRGAKLHYLTGRSRATPSCAPDGCTGADLSYADLSGAVLNFTDLSYAQLVGADLTDAELRSANLDMADLFGATLTSTDFTGALNCATAQWTASYAGLGCADDPTSAPTCYAYSSYEDATGTFVVTGNTFSQVSTYAIPDNDTQITSLTVEAWVTIPNLAITSASRSFTVGFSGASTGTFAQTLNGLQPPWSSSSGTVHRTLPWDVADTGYDASSAGHIRVLGAGSIGTWSANPNQRIYVIVHITGTTRTPMPCS